MKPGAYASLTAFLAHWRALKHASAGALNVDELARRNEMDELARRNEMDELARRNEMDELARRNEMDEIIALLRPEERAALEAASADDRSAGAGAARRHRERAEVRLARELRARGLLAE
jgi:hypothetical protein